METTRPPGQPAALLPARRPQLLLLLPLPAHPRLLVTGTMPASSAGQDRRPVQWRFLIRPAPSGGATRPPRLRSLPPRRPPVPAAREGGGRRGAGRAAARQAAQRSRALRPFSRPSNLPTSPGETTLAVPPTPSSASHGRPPPSPQDQRRARVRPLKGERRGSTPKATTTAAPTLTWRTLFASWTPLSDRSAPLASRASRGLESLTAALRLRPRTATACQRCLGRASKPRCKLTPPAKISSSARPARVAPLRAAATAVRRRRGEVPPPPAPRLRLLLAPRPPRAAARCSVWAAQEPPPTRARVPASTVLLRPRPGARKASRAAPGGKRPMTTALRDTGRARACTSPGGCASAPPWSWKGTAGRRRGHRA